MPHSASSGLPPPTYALCPTCGRSVPATLGEMFCSNDGTRLLTGCPVCGQPILSPFAQHCTHCGAALLSTRGEP
ncbi:double zinc ribbon domain-containing protein [Deinococcus rubellus]|uniref:double zinc ribbon domain-containing protein n=1 Tax=Deinococcus rubellus TaxID=1889240 RepID=UPI0031EDC091